MTLRSNWITPGDGDPRHGSMNGYVNLRCRCVPCTGAWAVYYREMRVKPRDLPPGDDRHGTASSYSWWHCRCEGCLAAHSASNYLGNVRRARRNTTKGITTK